MLATYWKQISALARKGFREGGRGYVMVAAAPDSVTIRYETDFDEFSAPSDELQKMVDGYEEATSAVVVLTNPKGAYEEVLVATFMSLAPDEGNEPLASMMEFEPNAPTEMSLYPGEDYAFVNRNLDELKILASTGFSALGRGAIVVSRAGAPEESWSKSGLTGFVDESEKCSVCYVAAENIPSNLGVPPAELCDYDPHSRIAVVVVRQDSMPTGYQFNLGPQSHE